MATRISLMIAGAQKGGSTSLFQYLSEHPEVCVHGQREMTFFVNADEYAQGVSSRAWQRYLESPGTGAFVAKHVKLMHSAAGVDRLFQHDSGVQVAVVLREPVARAYSAFWYARSRGREELEAFDEALDREAARLAKTVPWHDVGYVANGLYADAVERLRDVFGRDRVHVILNEDLRANALGVCRSLFSSLGVDPDFEPAVGRIHNRAVAPRSGAIARVNRWVFESRAAPKLLLRKLLPDRVAYRLRHAAWKLNDQSFQPPPMAAHTRARLREVFHPDNERLRALLGRSLDGWS